MSLQILISIWYNATPGSVSTKGVFLMFFIPRDSQNPVLIRFIYVLLESRGKNSRQTTGECGRTHVNGFSQSRQKWNNLLPSFQQILQQKIFRSIQPQKILGLPQQTQLLQWGTNIDESCALKTSSDQFIFSVTDFLPNRGQRVTLERIVVNKPETTYEAPSRISVAKIID